MRQRPAADANDRSAAAAECARRRQPETRRPPRGAHLNRERRAAPRRARPTTVTNPSRDGAGEAPDPGLRSAHLPWNERSTAPATHAGQGAAHAAVGGESLQRLLTGVATLVEMDFVSEAHLEGIELFHDLVAVRGPSCADPLELARAGSRAPRRPPASLLSKLTARGCRARSRLPAPRATPGARVNGPRCERRRGTRGDRGRRASDAPGASARSSLHRLVAVRVHHGAVEQASAGITEERAARTHPAADRAARWWRFDAAGKRVASGQSERGAIVARGGHGIHHAVMLGGGAEWRNGVDHCSVRRS